MTSEPPALGGARVRALPTRAVTDREAARVDVDDLEAFRRAARRGRAVHNAEIRSRQYCEVCGAWATVYADNATYAVLRGVVLGPYCSLSCFQTVFGPPVDGSEAGGDGDESARE